MATMQTSWQECNKLNASKNEGGKNTANLHEEKVRLASQDKPSEDSSTMATPQRPLWLVHKTHSVHRLHRCWIFDTGATSHMTPGTGMFSGSLRPHSGYVKFTNGERGAISGIVSAKLRCRLSGRGMGLAVFLVPRCFEG